MFSISRLRLIFFLLFLACFLFFQIWLHCFFYISKSDCVKLDPKALKCIFLVMLRIRNGINVIILVFKYVFHRRLLFKGRMLIEERCLLFLHCIFHLTSLIVVVLMMLMPRERVGKFNVNNLLLLPTLNNNP